MEKSEKTILIGLIMVGFSVVSCLLSLLWFMILGYSIILPMEPIVKVVAFICLMLASLGCLMMFIGYIELIFEFKIHD